MRSIQRQKRAVNLHRASKFNWGPNQSRDFWLALPRGDGWRRAQRGAHYTGKEHIMRVIGPLFVGALLGRYDAVVRLKKFEVK